MTRRPATPAPPPRLSVLDCMDSPKIFGNEFQGPSWDRWRVFLAALYGPLDDDDLAVFRHHTGRATAPSTPFREAALICGRRGGKSRILALIAVYIAAFVDHRPKLAAGEYATVAIIAADRRQARTVFRYITGLMQSVPALAALIDVETADSLTLTNRVAIEVHTASFRVTRGYSLAAVLCDEIAFWRSEETSAVPDVEILRAIRPGLSNLGGLLLLASSPYAKRGALWNAMKHFGKDNSRVLVWRGTTREMNPNMDAAEIEQAREEDPQAAAAEFDACFRDDVAGFLTRDLIDAAVETGRIVLPPLPGVRYVAFADPSGGAGDSFTAAIAHLEKDVAVLDAIYERRPPFNPTSAVAEIVTWMREYRCNSVTGDRYAAGWVVEAFKARGMSYVHSERDRSAIYMDALALFTSGRVRLLDNSRMASQFSSLERRTGAGRDRVDHPPGGHDDLANAAAGALTLASVRKGPIIFTAEALAACSRPEPGSAAWRRAGMGRW